jgi:hypothetical protein
MSHAVDGAAVARGSCAKSIIEVSLGIARDRAGTGCLYVKPHKCCEHTAKCNNRRGDCS